MVKVVASESMFDAIMFRRLQKLSTTSTSFPFIMMVLIFSEAHLEPSRASTMELFWKIVNGF